MVVDTSALFAILVGEDERDQFENLILRSPTAVISVVSIVETVIALTRKQLNIEASDIDGVLSTLGIAARPVDVNQGLLARRAFLQYGRGRHPARLNFGDCFPYALALAKARGDALLFKGEDFSKTDLIPAWQP
jgi:ribonuclease VapC